MDGSEDLSPEADLNFVSPSEGFFLLSSLYDAVVA